MKIPTADHFPWTACLIYALLNIPAARNHASFFPPIAADDSLHIFCNRIYLNWEINSLELLKEGAMMTDVLPKALKNGTDMVTDGEFVIELASGSCMFHICRKREENKQKLLMQCTTINTKYFFS